MQRWAALDRLQHAGVPVFDSMSPTYPTLDADDFHELLSYFSALGESSSSTSRSTRGARTSSSVLKLPSRLATKTSSTSSSESSTATSIVLNMPSSSYTRSSRWRPSSTGLRFILGLTTASSGRRVYNSARQPIDAPVPRVAGLSLVGLGRFLNEVGSPSRRSSLPLCMGFVATPSLAPVRTTPGALRAPRGRQR